ncbi:F-box protein [Actinidia chinensis var. chinensis]|uniref:F-box protein n=1 Tax=Actinidia chinensis var. chinensis TaxID=1590841 RepID=A0A2R6RGC6_ACTCC|nr:F-box protein [Actinidia chinensis var. chinensis]
MADLPSEIVADILSRLPVKPLLCFRSVSKPWCALIDSPDFIKTHLSRSIQTQTDLSLILSDTIEPRLHSLCLDSLDRAIELNPPLRKNRTQVWGSSNGLLCLANAAHDVVLWNPWTKKYHKLPVSPVENPSYVYNYKTLVYGFGYDSVFDDYKVVKIMQFHVVKPEGACMDSEVYVFSLKSNSWRTVSNLPFSLALGQDHGLLARGALHWDAIVGEGDEPSIVVAFDIAREGYFLLPQPEYEDPNFGFLSLGVLEGCLCVLCSYSEVGVDIWAMKEYGIKESWAKLISIKNSISVRFFDELRPIAYSKCGGKLLIQHDAHKFILYDLESKVIEKVEIRGLPEEFEVMLCSGSLVPLGSGGGASDGKKQ